MTDLSLDILVSLAGRLNRSSLACAWKEAAALRGNSLIFEAGYLLTV